MISTLNAENKKTGLYIRMSSAGKCRRQIGYEVLGYPESDPTPREGRNVMDLGEAVESLLIRLLREEGWEIDMTRWDGGQQIELRLDGPPRVGHPDGRCRHPELTSNLWVLLECKGMNSHQYRRFLSEGFVKSHPQYMGQVAHYGIAMCRSGYITSPEAAVVTAMDRDSGRWGYQRIRWEPELYDSRTTKLSLAWDVISMGELPERDYDGTTWQCNPKYCRWSSLCWQGSRPVTQSLVDNEGILEASKLAEGTDLVAAAGLWRDGKELEVNGKNMEEEARDVFQDALSRHGAKKLSVDGLTVTSVVSHRRNWDEKLLRSLLTPEQILQAQRSSESASLRITDSQDDAVSTKS